MFSKEITETIRKAPLEGSPLGQNQLGWAGEEGIFSHRWFFLVGEAASPVGPLPQAAIPEIHLTLQE